MKIWGGLVGLRAPITSAVAGGVPRAARELGRPGGSTEGARRRAPRRAARHRVADPSVGAEQSTPGRVLRDSARRERHGWRAHRQRTAHQAPPAHGHEHHATVRGHTGARAWPPGSRPAAQRDQDALAGVAPREERYRQREHRQQAEGGVEHHEQTLPDRTCSDAGGAWRLARGGGVSCYLCVSGARWPRRRPPRGSGRGYRPIIWGGSRRAG